MGTAEVSVQKLGREWSCALSALKEIDPQGSLKLSELSDLVARFGPSEDDPARCNLPTIDKYPTAQRLEAMVSLAIHLIQREYVEALDPEVRHQFRFFYPHSLTRLRYYGNRNFGTDLTQFGCYTCSTSNAQWRPFENRTSIARTS